MRAGYKGSEGNGQPRSKETALTRVAALEGTSCKGGKTAETVVPLETASGCHTLNGTNS